MAGIFLAPFAAGTFIASCIIVPYVPALSLFTMPAILTVAAIFNLNIDLFNYLFKSLGFKSLQWWNILLAVLFIIGLLPSFIFVIPGFNGIVLTFLLTPVWIVLEILFTIVFSL